MASHRDSPRIILVTGANGGLGQTIAQAFLQANPSDVLYLGVRNHRDRAATLATAYPNRCQILDLDVTERSAWDKAVESVLAQHEHLDVLINNAGQHQDHLLATMPPDAWNQVLQANLTGVFHGCQAVLPPMISQRQGRIINIASLSALLAPPGQTNYAAAKAGVIGLTQSLAKEVARIGITVNAICPGYIETDALANLTPEHRRQAQSQIPMRRFGRPEEVAAAVTFLASPQASYITGSALKIDGGIF